jgi:hypothetical protein
MQVAQQRANVDRQDSVGPRRNATIRAFTYWVAVPITGPPKLTWRLEQGDSRWGVSGRLLFGPLTWQEQKGLEGRNSLLTRIVTELSDSAPEPNSTKPTSTTSKDWNETSGDVRSLRLFTEGAG